MANSHEPSRITVFRLLLMALVLALALGVFTRDVQNGTLIGSTTPDAWARSQLATPIRLMPPE